MFFGMHDSGTRGFWTDAANRKLLSSPRLQLLQMKKHALFLLAMVCFSVSLLAQERIDYPGGTISNSFSDNGSTQVFGMHDPSISYRYQQVFASSEFTRDGIQGMWISSIAFRPDDAETHRLGGVDFEITKQFDHLTVQLSTTAKQVDSLSPVFAENVGRDAFTVVNGPRVLSFPFNTPDPAAFNIKINFDHPFYYAPANGNLLIDITKTGIGSMGYAFDGPFVLGDSTSSVGNLAGKESGFTGTFGFIMEFELTRVPEPRSIALLAMGSVVWFGIGRRRK